MESIRRQINSFDSIAKHRTLSNRRYWNVCYHTHALELQYIDSKIYTCSTILYYNCFRVGECARVALRAPCQDITEPQTNPQTRGHAITITLNSSTARRDNDCSLTIIHIYIYQFCGRQLSVVVFTFNSTNVPAATPVPYQPSPPPTKQ